MSSQPQGWQPDPFGHHADRWFSEGRPTHLVRDGAVVGHDEPPADAVVPAPTPARATDRGAGGGGGSARAGDPTVTAAADAALPRPSGPQRARVRRAILRGEPVDEQDRAAAAHLVERWARAGSPRSVAWLSLLWALISVRALMVSHGPSTGRAVAIAGSAAFIATFVSFIPLAVHARDCSDVHLTGRSSSAGVGRRPGWIARWYGSGGSALLFFGAAAMVGGRTVVAGLHHHAPVHTALGAAILLLAVLLVIISTVGLVRGNRRAARPPRHGR